MPWVTYRAHDGVRAGVVVDGFVHGLPLGVELLSLIGAGDDGLAAAADQARKKPDHRAELPDVTLLAPIPRPASIRDFLCFLDHKRNVSRAQGLTDELAPVWRQIPAMYFGNSSSVVGPYDDVPVFPGSKQMDLELEVAAVIGLPGRDLDPKTAHAHIAGYAMFCDWTARDLQAFEAGLAISQAKGKDGASTLGPWLVTARELADVTFDGQLSVEVEALVNGQRLTRGNLGSADWRFSEIVAYASRGTTLSTGDVIASGTVPYGCLLEHVERSDSQEFDRWLKPGDVVSIGCDRLGYTSNRVVEGVPVRPLRTGY